MNVYFNFTTYTKVNSKWVKDLDSLGVPRCVFKSWLGLHSLCDFGPAFNLYEFWGLPVQVYL